MLLYSSCIVCISLCTMHEEGSMRSRLLWLCLKVSAEDPEDQPHSIHEACMVLLSSSYHAYPARRQSPIPYFYLNLCTRFVACFHLYHLLTYTIYTQHTPRVPFLAGRGLPLEGFHLKLPPSSRCHSRVHLSVKADV